MKLSVVIVNYNVEHFLEQCLLSVRRAMRGVDGEFKDVELDVVAESLDRQHILIGECKWTSGENGRLLTNEILKIAEALPFTKGKQVEIVLFNKVTPKEDVGNSILPQEVIALHR